MNCTKVVNIQSLCRICLAEKTEMLSLNSRLKIPEQLKIIDAVEMLMFVKIKVDSCLPSRICKVCLDLIAITYDLKQRFLNSQKFLQNLLGQISAVLPVPTPVDQRAPVEIIVGNEKYDVKDLVIVENDQQENSDFTGFLRNLGKTVSVSFVNKEEFQIQRKQHEEEPMVMLEKVNKIDKTQTKINYNFLFDLERQVHFENLGIINPSRLDQELVVSALNKQFECSSCNKVYSNEIRFKTHLSICGKQTYKLVASNPNCFVCTVCIKTFEELELLKSHIKTMHGVKEIACDICNLSFSNRKRYLYHKFTRHSEKNYTCDICGKGFHMANLLKGHMKRHKTNKVTACICSVCGKSFNYKGALYYHMKMHNNIRNYHCDYCDRKFYTIMAKKRHLRTHTGERPYQCVQCNKRFFSTGELKKHQFVHTGVSSYICSLCNKHFSSKFNLNLHLTYYPGDYVCEICDKGFVSVDVLQFHCKRKHKDKENILKNDEEIEEIIKLIHE